MGYRMTKLQANYLQEKTGKWYNSYFVTVQEGMGTRPVRDSPFQLATLLSSNLANVSPSLTARIASDRSSHSSSRLT